MAYLKAAARAALPSSDFLSPKDHKLPVHDEGHWRAARGRIGSMKGLNDDQRAALVAKWERIGHKRGWLKKDDSKSDEKAQKLSDVISHLSGAGASEDTLAALVGAFIEQDEAIDLLAEFAEEANKNPWTERITSLKT